MWTGHPFVRGAHVDGGVMIYPQRGFTAFRDGVVSSAGATRAGAICNWWPGRDITGNLASHYWKACYWIPGGFVARDRQEGDTR